MTRTGPHQEEILLLYVAEMTLVSCKPCDFWPEIHGIRTLIVVSVCMTRDGQTCIFPRLPC